MPATNAGTSPRYSASSNFDGDCELSIGELQRAFRALGLEKRAGQKLKVDEQMFKMLDGDGDGLVSLAELEKNINSDLRAKIDEKLNMGWKFDEAKWAKSIQRHTKWDMSKVFKQFDTDGDGFLAMDELQRGFRALGLQKRSGDELTMDTAMFNSFDTNGDGVVSLREFEENLFPKTRKKIEEKLDAGWHFDAKKWAGSQKRNGH